jgi:hypothetical protein
MGILCNLFRIVASLLKYYYWQDEGFQMQLNLFLVKKIMTYLLCFCMAFESSLLYATDSTSNLNKDSSGVFSLDVKKGLTGVGNQKNTLIEELALFAMTMVGTKLILYPKWTYDMKVAAASSAIFMTGSIIEALKSQKEMEDLQLAMTLRSDGKIDSSQIEHIKKLRESYAVIEKSLKVRSKLQLTALAGFLASAAMATWQAYTEEGMEENCLVTAGLVSKEFKICAATSGISPADRAACEIASTQADALIALIKEKKAAEFQLTTEGSKSVVSMNETEAWSLKAADLMFSTVDASQQVHLGQKRIQNQCEQYIKTKVSQTAGGTSPVDANDPPKLFIDAPIAVFNPVKEFNFIKISKNIFELFIPSALALKGSLFSLVGGATIGLTVSFIHMGKYVDKFIDYPKHRIFLWLGFASATGVIIYNTGKKIDRTRANIQKIDDLLKVSNVLTQSVKSSNASIVNQNLVGNTDIENAGIVLPDGKRFNCVEGATVADKTKCNSLTTLSNGSNLTMTGLNPAVATYASQVYSATDLYQGKSAITGSNLSALSNISSNTGAISKALKSQLDAYGSLIKKDANFFENQKENFLQGSKKGLESALAQKGLSASGVLASIGFNSMDNKAMSNDNESNKTETVVKKFTPGLIESGNSGEKSNALSLSFKEEKPQVEMQANAADPIKNLKFNMSDTAISSDNKISIFEIISGRYLKTGYPRLLDEEK